MVEKGNIIAYIATGLMFTEFLYLKTGGDASSGISFIISIAFIMSASLSIFFFVEREKLKNPSLSDRELESKFIENQTGIKFPIGSKERTKVSTWIIGVILVAMMAFILALIMVKSLI